MQFEQHLHFDYSAFDANGNGNSGIVSPFTSATQFDEFETEHFARVGKLFKLVLCCQIISIFSENDILSQFPSFSPEFKPNEHLMLESHCSPRYMIALDIPFECLAVTMHKFLTDFLSHEIPLLVDARPAHWLCQLECKTEKATDFNSKHPFGLRWMNGWMRTVHCAHGYESKQY